MFAETRARGVLHLAIAVGGGKKKKINYWQNADERLSYEKQMWQQGT